ncbi:Eukaryotic translation initiation factor 2C [Quaeritorhiza haematococci]|nr:Eukaryotic translation initiation factor 2C [Quaeritorhiza haematococci]
MLTATTSTTLPPPETNVQNAIAPRRPGVGTKGRKIKLWANFYPVAFPDRNIMQYDVDIVEGRNNVLPAAVNRRIIDAWRAVVTKDPSWSTGDREVARLAVYDGQKMLYAPKNLKIAEGVDTFKIQVEEEDSPGKFRNFTVKLKKTTEVNLERLHYYLKNKRPSSGSSQEAIDFPSDALMALQVLLRHSPSLRLTTYGRANSFYSPTDRTSLPDGLAVHFGWFQSLRPAASITYRDLLSNGQLLLNLDVAATAFYEAGPLIDVVAKFFNRRNIDACGDALRRPQEHRRLEKYVNNLMIHITYRNASGRYKYKVRGLTQQGAKDIKITLRDEGGATAAGRKVTIAQYFEEYNKVKLNYPWLPCIVTGAKKDIKIPMELCNVKPNQRHIGKVSDRQAAEMIKVTAAPPQDRLNKIKDGVGALHGANDKQFLDAWGVKIADNMLQVDGRVLPPPRMSFSIQSQSGREVSLKEDGQWRLNQGQFYSNPGSLVAWSVAVFASPHQVPLHNLEGFLNGLGNSLQIYADVKRAAETTDLSLMTQCCLSKFVEPRTRPAYWDNLALKVNAKLGGVNSHLDPGKELMQLPNVTKVPTMILGADVTHPPPGAGEGVSIAAVVASMDAKFYEYRTSIRLQGARQEIIMDLGDMVKELFILFRERANIFPKRIIFYRDGVSEGQFGEVVLQEVSALKRMLVSIRCADTKITFLCVNKRHHARFFPVDRRDTGRSGNTLPGTVVDTGVVHPFEFDFFLNSHPGLKGTSRPAHYHVLYDENQFSADNIQEFTYRLCYLYCRSTRAVSIVPPAYYAHLVAARARCYVTRMTGDTSELSSEGGSVTAGPAEMAAVTEVIQKSMFFT